MIGRLTGVLVEKNPPQVLVDCRGVGYEVDVPMSTFYHLPMPGEAIVLHTHFVVREDAQLLFGFGSLEERRVFRQLLKISGVGPKLALSVLSGLSIADLAQAVIGQEVGMLIKIPGVGKKTAERLLLELRDKVDIAALNTGTLIAKGSEAGDVVNALIGLGYSDREATQAVKQLPEGLAVADAIRQALRMFSKA
ncbi:MAG: Holliday junction branch migration protein RuvA [Pseudomonadota bacterium]